MISVTRGRDLLEGRFGTDNLHAKPCRNDALCGKPQRGRFPHMLVGYMRVSTDGDRQVFDLQRDLESAVAALRQFEDVLDDLLVHLWGSGSSGTESSIQTGA